MGVNTSSCELERYGSVVVFLGAFFSISETGLLEPVSSTDCESVKVDNLGEGIYPVAWRHFYNHHLCRVLILMYC